VPPDYRFPRELASLAIDHYQLGELQLANTLLKEIENRSKVTPTGSPAFYIAMTYAQIGEINKDF